MHHTEIITKLVRRLDSASLSALGKCLLHIGSFALVVALLFFSCDYLLAHRGGGPP